MRIAIGSVTLSLRPRLHRIIVALSTWKESACSQLLGDYKLAGCIPYVPTQADRADVLGDYLFGGP